MDTVVEVHHRFLIDVQEALRHALLCHLVLQVPDAVLVRELLVHRATLRQDAALEAAHVEQQVGVVLAVHGHETVLPLNRHHRPRQPVLNVPKHCATSVYQQKNVFNCKPNHTFQSTARFLFQQKM